MKKAAALSILVIALLLVTVESSDAHGRRHRGVRTSVVLGFGPAFWWGPPYPYWWYHPPYYSPPAVIVHEPPVYIQQQQPPAPPAPQSFWYYCSPAKAYYPNVQACPEAWIKVPAKTD